MTNAFNTSLKILSRKDLPAMRLKEKLYAKNFTESEIENAIDELIKCNYLNDDRYMEMRVRGLLRKRVGPYLIIHKLEQEGLNCSENFILDVANEAKINIEENRQYLYDKKLEQLNTRDHTISHLKTKQYLKNKGY